MGNLEILIKITSQSMKLQMHEAAEMLVLPSQDFLYSTISGAIGSIGKLTIYQYIFMTMLHDAITAAAAAEGMNTETPIVKGVPYDPTNALSIKLFSASLTSVGR
uniref:Cadherin-4 n=1 Tax=Lygus hesperus TaxID=30085 RepID=A0A0A9YCI7_LYGHE